MLTMSDPSATIIDTSNLLGQTVSGRYAIQEILGEGSMGVVFLAEHTHFKKKVALKVMRAEFLDNPEAVERFQREAQATGHIEHPNVCTATDFGQLEDDRFFLVMEYLDGMTLGDLLDSEQRLEPARAVKLTLQIARGLQRAHELEVIHRDLKPDNVLLVEREGDPEFVKITDFGVARVEVVDAQNLTQAGTTMGTPVYMSPEQAVAARADVRSDLYTLGVMLFEMLAGEVPFYSDSLAVILSMHANEPAPSMHDVAPDAMIPQDLCEIVERLLHKNPDQRFQTALELISALETADLSPWVPGLGGASSAGSTAAPAQLSGPVVSGSDVFGSDPEIPASVADLAPPPGAIERPNLFEKFSAMPVAARYGIVFGAMLVLVIPILAAALFLVSDTPEFEAVSEGGMAFSEDEVAPPDLEGEREEFLEDVDLDEKFAELAPDAQIAALEPLLAEHDADPHLRYLLGRATADTGSPADAMPYYAAAVQTDARYAGESRLLSDARRLFSDNSNETAAPAQPVMLALLRSANPQPPEAALLEVAIDGPWNARKRSRDLLKEAGRWDGLAAWQQHAIDLGLVGRSGCETALKHIRALSDGGERDALPALKKASRRPKEGCGFLKKQDCYKCMRGELAATINKLEKLPKTSAAAEQDTGASP